MNAPFIYLVNCVQKFVNVY